MKNSSQDNLLNKINLLKKQITELEKKLAHDISERKKIENELLYTNERYTTLFDNIGVGIAFISSEMRILDLNDQMKEWFPTVDVSKKPICYEAFNDPPRKDICSYCPTYKTLKDGKIHESTTDTPVGGEVVNYRVVSSPIKNDEGEVVAAIELVEDITTRKKMEEDLKRAYATLNSIFEGPENIIAFSLDRNYQYIFFNQAHSQTMKGIWGVDIEIGKSMLEYISYPEDRNKAKINFNRALSGENFIELEDYGEETLSRRYWENIYNPIQSGGDIIGFTVFCVDITERQRAAENLRQSEEKFRAVAESATDAIITADSKGMITFFNHSLLELFGYTASELSGKPVSILIPKGHKNGHEKGMVSFKSGEMVRTGKTSMAIGLKEDGTEFPCEMSLSVWKSGEDTYFTSIIRDLTERKKAEEALKFSQIQLSNAMDLAHLANWELDPDNQMFIFTDKFYSMLGTTAENEGGYSMPIEKYIKRYVHPEDAQFIANGMKKSLNIGEPTFGPEFEHRIIRRDGDIRYVAIQIRVIPATKNESAHIYGTVQDITGRKMVEEALRESEVKYRTIFENVQDIFFQTDIKGKIIEISPSVEKYFGVSPKELVGSHVDTLYLNSEDRKKLLKVLQEKGEVSDYEITLKDSKNRLIQISANVHFILDSNYRPVGIEGALRDITERKKAEEALKAQYHFLERLINTIPYPIFYKNVGYVYIGCNKSFEKYIGLPKDEIIGKTVYDLSPKDLADKYHQMDHDLMESGQLQVYEAPVRYADGSRHIVIFNKSTFNDPEGNVAGIIGVMVDITQRKKTEDQLKESLEEKEMLLKEIHHRVKNNLMVISSLLNLQSQYIKDKEALDIFKESQNRAKSMALIHERLYRSTDLKKIDFGDYIHTLAIDLFHTYVRDPTRVKLNMDLENVMVDINTTVPLGLIVNELVTNSMKHAFPDGAEGEVIIEFHKKEGEFLLIVSDTGVGFPENVDFRNTDSLGLQLVNNLVSQIDGEISLNKSHGTEFKITFKDVEY